MFSSHLFSRFYLTLGLRVSVIKETEETEVEGRVIEVVTQVSPSLRSPLTQPTLEIYLMEQCREI